MSISVTCPACQHTLKVKDEFAGKRGACPKCQATIQIPAAAALVSAAAGGVETARPAPRTAVGGSGPAEIAKKAAPAARKDQPAPRQKALSRDDVAAAIGAAFTAKFTPPKASLARKLATILVLGIVLLLPLFYIAALAGAMYGLYWLATSSVGANLPTAAFYAALIGGGLVVLALLKPLVAPRRRTLAPLPLPPADEQQLHEFIGLVCQEVNAAPPRIVQTECSPVFVAEYRRGLLGLLQRDVVLTVGLPLLGSLSAEQFAGLVAERMAQFRKGAGCRATNLIRAVNGWLWRSVYEQDRLDQGLTWITTRRQGLHLGKLLWPLWGIKFIAQVVLWIPMFIGNTVASALVRRTELDADRCHYGLTGSGPFAETIQRLRIIDFTWEGVLSELAFLHRDQQLPDSLPHQLQLRMVDMTPDLCSTLLETVVKPQEKPFDARPNDADRIEAARRENAPGVLKCPLPAHALLTNYDKTAQELTWDYYSAQFGAQLLRTALKRVLLPA